MDSKITIESPSGTGKGTFIQCMRSFVKLFYAEAEIGEHTQGHASGSLHFDITCFDQRKARGVARALKLMEQPGAVVINSEGVPEEKREELCSAIQALIEGYKAKPDQCAKTLKGCRERFASSAGLPFGGFLPASRLVSSDGKVEITNSTIRLGDKVFVYDGPAVSLYGTQNMGHA